MAGIVTLFESTDAGAPTLNNAVGSLIAVLDACLITGYNTKSVTSITVASGVATVVCAGHGFSNIYGKIIRHMGATPAGLNIDVRISGVTTNGYTYLCPGVADGVATGTITAKYAPMDWTKQYSGTNKAMYKRSDVAANGCMLRVDDTIVGQSARVLMVQSATGIDTYTNESPTTTQIAGGQHWIKGFNTAVACPWVLISDGLFFYFFCAESTTTTSYYMAHLFGDVPSLRVADTLNCTLGGGLSSTGGSNYALAGGNNGALFISGGKTGVTISQLLTIYTKTDNYGQANTNTYPSDVDGGLVVLYPTLLPEGTPTGHIRAVMPGLAIPVANITALGSKLQVSVLNGRVYLIMYCRNGAGGGIHCIPLIDLTGPWR